MTFTRTLACICTLTASAAGFAAAGLGIDLRGAKVGGLQKRLLEATAIEASAGECGRFALDQKQVRHYFDLAEIIGPETRQSAYDWLPCEMEGSLELAGASYRFSINAGGTARLWIDSQEPILLGCRTRCNVLFNGLYPASASPE